MATKFASDSSATEPFSPTFLARGKENGSSLQAMSILLDWRFWLAFILIVIALALKVYLSDRD